MRASQNTDSPGRDQRAIMHFYWTSHPASSVGEHVYLSVWVGLGGTEDPSLFIIIIIPPYLLLKLHPPKSSCLLLVDLSQDSKCKC